jgi:hypothetical protein
VNKLYNRASGKKIIIFDCNFVISSIFSSGLEISDEIDANNVQFQIKINLDTLSGS